MIISKEILSIIEKTSELSVQKFAQKYRIKDINFYKKTEFLLYAYPTLKDIIELAEKDILDMIEEGETGKSKDITMMPKPNEGIREDRSDIIQQRIQSKKDSLKVTEIDVKQIERALDKIEPDDMDLIVLKYFDKMTMFKIAEKLHCSESTIKRKRREVVNKIALRLFGSEVVGI